MSGNGRTAEQQAAYDRMFEQQKSFGFSDAAAQMSALNQLDGFHPLRDRWNFDPIGVTDGATMVQPIEWPAPLDLRALAQREPQAPRHVISDWLPAGEVTLCAGHGGGGKSLVALYVAVCIALGRSPWLGAATEQRRVLYVSAEDSADVLHWRLARICAHLGVTMDALAEMLELIDASRMNAELMVDVPHDEPALTIRYTELHKIMRPDDVVVLDGASDLYGASEIVRRHVRRYVRALRQLCGARGAVLLLAHVDKAAARDGATTDRYSGSTAWHNSVRSRWSLTTDADGSIVLALAKANYARAGAEVRLRWDDDAHLYRPAGNASDGGMVGAIRDQVERRGILRALVASTDAGLYVPAAMTGPRTAWHVLSERAEFPAALRASDGAARRRFWRAIEALRQMRHVDEVIIRRSNRHQTVTLAPTPEGRADAPNNE